MKFLVLAFALGSAALPAIAGPGNCHHDQQTAQMTCTEGMVWDEKAGGCVKLAS